MEKISNNKKGRNLSLLKLMGFERETNEDDFPEIEENLPTLLNFDGKARSASLSITKMKFKKSMGLRKKVFGFSGILFKQGHNHKSWKERHFIVDSSMMLRYYELDLSKVKGEYQLSKNSIIEPLDGEIDGYSHLFTVSGIKNQAGKETLIMCASDNIQKDNWIKKLLEICRGYPLISEASIWPTSFRPVLDLVVNYRKKSFAGDGNILKVSVVNDSPRISFKPLRTTDYYSLIMYDIDARNNFPQSVNNNHNNEDCKIDFIHWVICNIPGSDITEGVTVVPYIGAAPCFLTEAHRYTFIVVKQNNKLAIQKIEKIIKLFSNIDITDSKKNITINLYNKINNIYLFSLINNYIFIINRN